MGAQDAKPIEVTPYVALGSEMASPVGAAVTFPVTSTLSVETDVAYRRGEGRIHALSSSTSLLYSLPRVGQSTPYVAAGFGLSQYGAPFFSSNGRPIGTLRTDARWFKLLGQGSDQFRVAQGISFGVGKR